MERKAPWRVLDMTNLPCSPGDPSRNDVWKFVGVLTFSLGVLVRGHGIHRTLTEGDTGEDEKKSQRCKKHQGKEVSESGGRPVVSAPSALG